MMKAYEAGYTGHVVPTTQNHEWRDEALACNPFDNKANIEAIACPVAGTQVAL